MTTRASLKGNRTARLGPLAVLLLPLMAACDDSFGPQPWDATPDTVLLYSASRSELLGLPSGYDFVQQQRVILESPGGANAWDIAVVEENGRFALLPAGAFEPLSSRAAIATTTETSLEAVRDAPSDLDAFVTDAVPIEIGAVYVVRTRRFSCGVFAADGERYAKIQAIAVDEALGTFQFAEVTNPFCSDRSLIPPEDD